MQQRPQKFEDRQTSTTILAHSLHKGDMIELSSTPVRIARHPQHFTFKGEKHVRLTVEYLPTGHVSRHECNYNHPIKYLLGGRGGGHR